MTLSILFLVGLFTVVALTPKIINSIVNDWGFSTSQVVLVALASVLIAAKFVL
jgi:hypothetical protein